MPDYKELYLHLFRETEKAVRILISAQQECEEMYLSAPEPELIVLEDDPGKERQVDTAGKSGVSKSTGQTGV